MALILAGKVLALYHRNVANRRTAAREVVQDRGRGEFWIDHAEVARDDISWLARAERLTLWNVQVPHGLLAQLPQLWWLDLRGGSATDLTVALGCARLRYLQVNQVRGMRDLSVVTTFPSLQLLSLYGLSKVDEAPSLRGLSDLKRLEVGQMRGLASLGGLVDAPNLKELLVVKRVGITDDDVAKINGHRALEQFQWIAEDVPAKISGPVIAAIRLTRARAVHAADWFQGLESSAR